MGLDALNNNCSVIHIGSHNYFHLYDNFFWPSLKIKFKNDNYCIYNSRRKKI